MNSFVKSLIQPLLEENQDGIALVPGGFKPPTLGHFYLVDQVAKHPEVSKVIVLIGHKTRDGVTKEESKEIWDIYQKYLPSNVEIKLSDNSSPISDVGSMIKNNPDTMFYPVVGIRGEMDLGDLKRFDSMKGKYENFKPIVIKSEGEDRISGTNTRAALIGGNKDKFLTYLPTELSNEDKEEVWDILQKTPLNEMYAEPSENDYPYLMKSLTEYMLDKGMNIRPLPKVKFVEDDIENARNFFGKTAYYDPNNRIIVLYTKDRHPKDIMRSFAHEMIHHEQNCDDRLGNIQTQNTNEDGDLPEIEREAYEKGNMTFRNWTDTLTEGVFKKSLDQTEKEALKIVDKNWDKFGGKECNNGFCDIFAKNLSKYLPGSTIMSTEDPRNETLGHVWVEYNGKYFDAETPNGVSSWKELPWMKEFYSKVGNYPTNIENINESIVGDRIECDNCDWSWPIKDGGDDLYVCHKCGHDNTPKQLNEGRYDKITNDISSAIFNHWKQDYEEGVDASRFDQTFKTDDLNIDIDANISFIPGSEKLNIDGGANADTGYLEVRFEVDPSMLPKSWSEISMNLKDVVRHEIEHLTHGEGFNENPPKLLPDDQFIRDMINADMLPKAAYFKLEKEIDANLQGMYLRAKKEKRPFGDVINSYLDAQDITSEEKEEILDIWRGRLKALNLPKF